MPEGLDLKEVAWKIYEKITPNLGLTIAGPTGALAASVMVVSTWLLLKARGVLKSRGGRLDDEQLMIVIYRELEEARRRLEEARSAGAPEEALTALSARVRWLEEQYDLVQIRIAARDSLRSIAGEDAVERLGRLVERLERGDEKAVGELADLLREVESLWRAREIEAEALRRLLRSDAFYPSPRKRGG